MEKWKTLKSERLFNRPWLTVRRDTVQLPNGNVNPEFYVLEYPDWINVIAITDDGKFVMEKQYRHGINDIRYELCAGVIEEGEEPEAAARRELLEETGYTGGEWEEICVISANPSVTNNWAHCFLAKGVKKTDTQHLEDTEDIVVELMTEDQVFELVKNEQIAQALMLVPLWKYFYLKQRF